tara:strand:+ start:1496 stop:2071 length:576 start_codon:yes stop_codon:yes gene_type:complete
MNAKNDLAIIQAEVQAPKNKFNSFGKYAYRSAENIIEAVKPIINPKGYHLILSDEMVIIGERYYIKATATISNGEQSYSATSYAREPEEKKGMDSAQISGTTGSYSRKYALNGLFALDDNKDSDATSTETKPNVVVEEIILTDDERIELINSLGACTELGHVKELWNNLDPKYQAIKQVRNLVTTRKNQLK